MNPQSSVNSTHSEGSLTDSIQSSHPLARISSVFSGKLLVAGDIGGTNSRLILFESFGSSIQEDNVVHINTYWNDDFPSFYAVLSKFLGEIWEGQHDPILAACFAVAGPVKNDYINFTNREGWIIDAKDIENNMNFGKVFLVNDFAANGYGIKTLAREDLVVLQDKPALPGAPIALVGAGTGLGECYVTPQNPGVDDNNYHVFSSEGGHVDFAPRNDLEVRLLKWFRKKLSDMPLQSATSIDASQLTSLRQCYTNPEPRVSVERIVSGRGLVNVYEFLCDEFPDRINQGLHEQIMNSKDKARVISVCINDYPLASDALDIMLSAYGSEVGNAALKYLPSGGLYIAGGIAPKNIGRITSSDSLFMKALFDKGRLKGLIENLPIYVVMKEDVGLRGAHALAFREAFRYFKEQNERMAEARRIYEAEREQLQAASAWKSKVRESFSGIFKKVNTGLMQSFDEYSVFWALGLSVTTSGLFSMYIAHQIGRLKN
eukprot:CAMPEP_0184692382 /NCGR_PEP_ID=MMETSP0313-20130426/888_1 /TAXON_ID=2792 /ORGANISM="Porphyridium aerugineum, Strain SAG 1380-2" /LENGTH=488 /DNA_ID=CAMNT_0027150209 /DNA_START=49 /DNA_END=1515 /DNA_ORIENTATION=+